MNWIPLRVISRPITLLLVGVSVVVLLRGHNEPGGGFIGGLLAASGFLVYGLSFGSAASARLLRVSPVRLIGLGLLLSLASGAFALFRGQPFLTGQWWGSLLNLGKAGTVLLFDVGVYMVVLGATALFLLRLLDPRCADPGGQETPIDVTGRTGTELRGHLEMQDTTRSRGEKERRP